MEHRLAGFVGDIQPATVADDRERCVGRQLAEVQAFEFRHELHVGRFAVEAEATVRRYLDGRDGMEDVDIFMRHRMLRELGQVQAGIQVLARMAHAAFVADLAAFQGDRRTQLGEGDGLHAERPDEVHHGARKQRRQMQVRLLDDVDAGVMRVQAGVVVYVHRGEHALLAHALDDRRHHPRLWRLRDLGAGPDTIEIRLAFERASPLRRRLHVADEQAQRARQLAFLRVIVAQQFAHRVPANPLVAVQQHRDEQRFDVSAGQMHQRRFFQKIRQHAGVEFKQLLGEFGQFLPHQIFHL